MKIIACLPVVALLLCLTAGCKTPPKFVPEWVMEHSEYGRTEAKDRDIESDYQDYIFEIQGSKGVESDPEATRQQLINRIRKKYAKDVLKTLYSVVVGQPPVERKVGYIEHIEYPRVLIYDRDMGRYDSVKIESHLVYDLNLDDPLGYITQSGATVRFQRSDEIDDSVLGRYTPGVGAVFILGVCPVTGVALNPDWLHPQVRTDIDRDNLNRIKAISARELEKLHQYYRTVKDLDPSFYKSVHGFYIVENGGPDFRHKEIVPIRLVELRAKDFHGKAMDRAPIRTVEKSTTPADESEED